MLDFLTAFFYSTFIIYGGVVLREGMQLGLGGQDRDC